MNVGSVASTGWNYVQRLAKLYPDFVLGTGQETVAKTIKETVKNRGTQNYFSAVWDGTKKGAKALETQVASSPKNFWQRTWHALRTTPKKVSQGWNAGGRIADRAGKTGLSKFWSQFKGSMSGLGKRMPLIGTLMIAAVELPNIFSAFSDKGIVGGVTETTKSGLRLGAGITGAAIGQALIPIPLVGTVIGFMAGDWLMSKFTGKSHSEKKMEAEEQLAQQQTMPQMNNPFMGSNPYLGTYPYAQGGFNIPQMTMTPQQLAQMQQMLYTNSMQNPMDQDFMTMNSGINRLNYNV